MAASKDFTSSIVKGSEETFDTCCTPCNEAGSTKEAKNFCVDCESYFCEDCLLHHNRFSALRSHQIMDKSGNERGQQKEAVTCQPTERCAVHHGKLIDMYCGNHDEVCCAACIAFNHRACVNVDHLPDIAKGMHDSAELKETLVSLKGVLESIKQEREKIVCNLASLDQEKKHLLREVEEYESELIQKINELAEDAKHQISTKHEECRKSVQTDVDKLDIVISTIASSVQKFSSRNEAQLFVNVKSGKKSVQDCKNLLREMSTGEGKKEIKFKPNIELRDMLTTLGSIFVDEENTCIKEYKATLYGKFKVAQNRSMVLGACVMEDGTFLVSDFTNNKLKRLNRDFTVKDQIDINSPHSLQIVAPSEIAVFCRFGQIQLVSVRDVMKITASFKTSGGSSGGSYNTSNYEMFLLQTGKLCICRKNGDIVRLYENKDITQNVEPKQTGLSNDNNTVFFANNDKGLLALTREGRTLWTFQDPELRTAWGVCVLPGEIILVSGVHSNNILQVDKNGKKIGILLGPSENITYPYALVFDRKSSKLLVAYNSHEINVYTLSEVK